MNFSGTIDEGSGMTMTRLIERFVHTDTPGELRLHDDASGRQATVAIRRGMVAEVSFGDLAGDAALTAISQSMPWTFEFISDEAGAVPAHPGIVSRKPKARAVIRTAVVPAAETEGVSDGEMERQRDGETERATEPAASPSLLPSIPPSLLPSIPPSPLPSVSPSLLPSHRAWIAAPDSAHCIRFGTAGGEFAGDVLADDHDYFRSDFAFLRNTAEGIARNLGWLAPTVFAIAEADRATGYAVLENGFLGAIGGAGTGVAHVMDFPRS